MSDDAKPGAPVAATGAGRGVLYIAIAKLYFMVIGAVIEFRLTAILSRTVFGAYGVVASVVSPFNNVMVTGSIQAVSRFTAQRPETARAVEAAGLRMHLWVGLPLALVVIASAPLVAWLMKDASKIAPLMLAGTIIAAYAFYAVMVGTANGLRMFQRQAQLDMTSATLRAAGILGLATLGFGVVGAYAGWVAAAFTILAIAAVVIGLPGKIAPEARVPVRPMIRYFARVAVYLILLNLIMFVDQLLLKRLTHDWYASHGAALAAGLDQALPWARDVSGFAVEPSALADVQVAYYRAVQNLARLSYQAIIAATFVVFPLVSRSTFEDDHDTTRPDRAFPMEVMDDGRRRCPRVEHGRRLLEVILVLNVLVRLERDLEHVNLELRRVLPEGAVQDRRQRRPARALDVDRGQARRGDLRQP